jgi:5-methylcytosine-specific restriction endonuclease McrA
VHETEYSAHRKTHKRTGSTPALKRQRLEVLARDQFTCTDCLRHESALPPGARLEVHHVDGDWRNDALSNLRLTCTDCHERVGHMWWAEDMLPNRSLTNPERPTRAVSRPRGSHQASRLV